MRLSVKSLELGEEERIQMKYLVMYEPNSLCGAKVFNSRKEALKSLKNSYLKGYLEFDNSTQLIKLKGETLTGYDF